MLRARLNQLPVTDRIKSLVQNRTFRPGAVAAGFGSDEFVHDLAPVSFDKTFIRRRQIRLGDLQIQLRLPDGFILGIEQGAGLGFVPGAQAQLLTGAGVFAVKNPGALKQDETLIHNCFMNREPVRPTRVNE